MRSPVVPLMLGAMLVSAVFVGCDRTTSPTPLAVNADRITPFDTTPPDTTPPDTTPPDTTPPPPPPPPSQGAGGVVQSATGSGHFAIGSELRTFAFTAVKRANGAVSGQFEAFNRSSNVRVHGEVICLDVLGNGAWIGAVVRHSSDSGAVQKGTETAWRVVDNGEGRAPPDQISLALANLEPGVARSYCAARPPVPALNTVQQGNIQVHDKRQPGDTL